jgi:hypothetical protein
VQKPGFPEMRGVFVQVLEKAGIQRESVRNYQSGAVFRLSGQGIFFLGYLPEMLLHSRRRSSLNVRVINNVIHKI